MSAPLVAVVAGGSRGAGRGAALALGDAKSVVYVVGRTSRAAAASSASAAASTDEAKDPAVRATNKGPKAPAFAKGTVDDTADEVTKRGGVGVAVVCDLTDSDAVDALFARVAKEQGRLDVVCLAVWGGNERLNSGDGWTEGFWRTGTWGWRDSMRSGPYAYYLTARAAAPLLAANPRGAAIVHITEPLLPPSKVPEAVLKPPAPVPGDDDEAAHAAGRAGGSGSGSGAGPGSGASTKKTDVDVPAGASMPASPPPGYMGNMFWDVAHVTINRMAYAMACELAPKGVASVAVSPGFMATERVLASIESNPEAAEAFGTPGETPEYVGRAVTALAKAMAAGGSRAEAVIALGTSGDVHPVGRLARAFGFTDVDGKQPWWSLPAES